MRSLIQKWLYLEDLTKDPPNCRFHDKSPSFLAGRCLLDVVEFLRTNDPPLLGQYSVLVDAHAIRLVCQCMHDLHRKDLVRRIRKHVKRTYGAILNKRKSDPPNFGDDFWDWAYVLDSFLVLRQVYPELVDGAALANDVRAFYSCVKERLSQVGDDDKPGRLLYEDADDAWFGPATPTAAHRALVRCGEFIADRSELTDVLSKLKTQALQPIKKKEGGHGHKFMGEKVVPKYHQWHYGQVLHEFGDDVVKAADDDHGARKSMRRLKKVDKIEDSAQKVYALSRMLQGLYALRAKEPSQPKWQQTINAALKKAYKTERSARPLGFGVVGDNIKASLNLLEAIWPQLSSAELNDVRDMLATLGDVQRQANTIGVVVAIDREEKECREAFECAGAKITEKNGYLQVDHEDFRVLIGKGKATVDVTGITTLLIEQGAKWIIMMGIAGSLGQLVEKPAVESTKPAAPSTGTSSPPPHTSGCGTSPPAAPAAAPCSAPLPAEPQKTEAPATPTCLPSPCDKLPFGHPPIGPKKEKELIFDGPDLGHVVIASSLAPYRLRDKVRKQIVNARVPRLGATYGMLPTDSVLFNFASQAAYEYMIDPKHVFEGLVVTGTGVKDNDEEKAAILKEFPGGLAVEEEGYSTALECAQKRIPQVVIRGISDRAGGDKQASNEEVLQPRAARNAAEVTVRVVQKLSAEWWADVRREDRV